MRDLSTALRMGLLLGLAAAPAGVPGAAPVLAPAARPAAATAAAVLRHDASISERNALVVEVRVTLARAARVFVEYDNPQAGRYRTPLSAPGAAHAIPLVRLRPETTYDYTIFVVEGSAVRGFAVDGAAADGFAAAGRFTTGPLPLALAAIPMRVRGRSSQPLILSDYPRGYYVFRDEVGGIVWYHYHAGFDGPIAQLPAGNLLFARGGSLVEVTPLGEVVDRFERGGAAGNPHHGLAVLGGGAAAERVIYLSRGPPQEGSGFVDRLRVWDRERGRFEQVWDSQEAWNLTRPAGGGFSWTHLNSVSIGPRGNVVLSSRTRHQVVSLDADSWTIEWQLHGPDSDYRFPDPTDRFYGQHTAAQLDNGNVLLFDNGWGRPAAEGGRYSRALELRLDEAAGTAVKVWEYRPTPDIYVGAKGSAYRLRNGNTLINFSRGDHAGGRSLVEVDAAGNEVFRIDTLPLHAGWDLPTRYRATAGSGAIMGETMLRPPAAAPAHLRAAAASKEYSLAKERARFRALEATLEGRPRAAAGGAFDLYAAEGRLVYAKDPCAPQDVRAPFFLHVFPAAAADLPPAAREQGFVNLDFGFRRDFAFRSEGFLRDGACLVAAALPEYEISHVRTGQFIRAGGRRLWSVEFPVGPTAAAGGRP